MKNGARNLNFLSSFYFWAGNGFPEVQMLSCDGVQMLFLPYPWKNSIWGELFQLLIPGVRTSACKKVS
jgi:hypothetical protein